MTSATIITQKRNVLYLKGQKFWIIGDYASPEDQSVKNSYEQNWNMLPTANVSYDEETMVIKSNFEDYNVTLVPISEEIVSLLVLYTTSPSII